MFRFELVYNNTTYNIDEPVGWSDLELILRKDGSYEGVFFERSGNLKFYGNAREIIWQALNTKHFEAEVIFRAYMQCTSETIFYEGKLNFSSYRDEDGLFECNIDQLDDFILFANNLERKENLNTCPSVIANLHSIVIRIDIPLHWDPNSSQVITSADPSPGIWQNVLFLAESQEESFTEYFTWHTNGTDTWLECLKPVSIQFTIPVIRMGCGFDVCMRAGNPEYSPSHSANFSVFGQTISFRPYDFDPYAQELYPPIGGFAYEEIFEGGTYTKVCNVGDILNMRYLFRRNPPPTGCDSIIQYNGNAMLHFASPITYNDPNSPLLDNFPRMWYNLPPAPPSPMQGYLVHELLDFLIKKASNNKFQLYSRYYGRIGQRDYTQNGCGAWRVLASGLQVRNINQANASFKDIYEGLQAMDNLALAYEKIAGIDYIRIEPKDGFFENTVIFTANNVSNLKLSLAGNKVFKLIDIGYQKWETELTGGLQEFNSTRQYESTNITQFKNTKKAISKLIAASYVIEKVRRVRFKPTADNPFDNDFFVFCVHSGNSPFTCEQTATLKHYNARIHPIRNLLNYRSEFSVGTVMGVGGNLKQTARTGGIITAEQNTFPIASPCNKGFTSLLDGTLIPLNTPLYKPIIAEFEYPITLQEFDLLKSNTNKLIVFSDECDNLMQGYIEEIRYKISEEMASFRLILK